MKQNKHYNKDDKEKIILYTALYKYKNSNDKSKEKSKIVHETNIELCQEGFNYDESTVSSFINNHRKKEIPEALLPSVLNRVSNHSSGSNLPIITKENSDQPITPYINQPFTNAPFSFSKYPNNLPFTPAPTTGQILMSVKQDNGSQNSGQVVAGQVLMNGQICTENNSIEKSQVSQEINNINDSIQLEEFPSSSGSSFFHFSPFSSQRPSRTSSANSDQFFNATSAVETVNQEPSKSEKTLFSLNFGYGKKETAETDSKPILEFPKPKLNESQKSNRAGSIEMSTETESEESQFIPDVEVCSEDPLIKSLPKIPRMNDQLTQNEWQVLKFDLYRFLQECYDILHVSATQYKNSTSGSWPIEFDPNRFLFQKELEDRFVTSSAILSRYVNNGLVYPFDKNINRIEFRAKPRTASRETRAIVNDNITMEYLQIRSPSSSGELPSFTSSSSGELPSFTSSSSGEFNQQPMKNSADLFTNSPPLENNEISVTSYFPRGVVQNINEKLSNFYLGIYEKSTWASTEISNVESITTVMFSYKTADGYDRLVSDFAYVVKGVDSHVLGMRGTEIDTGFFLKVTSMIFHRFANGENKIYCSGDVRVKEFTIKNLEEGQISIENTNTFYFGPAQYRSSAIAVWEDELVFACGQKLFFWDLNMEKKNRYTLYVEKNIEFAKRTSLDLNKVDWSSGNSPKKAPVDEEPPFDISSMEVIGDSKSGTFLALASDSYPVIYIYNKRHENIARLSSHTAGVTGLKVLQTELFSGSLDLTVRSWDLNHGVPTLYADTRDQKITSVEAGMYLDKCFVLSGGLNSTVQVINWTDKSPAFEIKLNSNCVPLKIGFVAGNEKQNGEKAKMIIIANNSPSGATYKACSVFFFEFI